MRSVNSNQQIANRPTGKVEAKRLCQFVGVILAQLLLTIDTGHPGEGKPTWQVEWEKTVEGAKREGQLNVFLQAGGYLQQFQKAYPEITVVEVGGGGARITVPRILSERRAGKYLLDIYAGGPDTPYVFYGAKALDPITPSVALPEVQDQSKWFEGKHRYVDPEAHYIFIFEGTAQPYINYNTTLVRAEEFKSYWDLLNPRWRARIVSDDPMIAGIVSHGLRFFYYSPELGPAFVRRLFSEMEITISRDKRQMLDWLAGGKFSLCLFCYGVDEGKKQGLFVDAVPPYSLKEGANVVPVTGTLALMNQAPHPNAAKVFINWLLSREGQLAYQKSRLSMGGADSLRIDVPKSDVPPGNRRKDGAKYLMTTRAEWIDMSPMRRLIAEVTPRKPR